MLRTNFEAIIAVQDRHIERLERMVEELFNVLRNTKSKLDLAKPVEPEAEHDYAYEMPSDVERHLVGQTVNRPLG